MPAINAEETIDLEFHTQQQIQAMIKNGCWNHQGSFKMNGSGWKHLYTLINSYNTENRQPDIMSIIMYCVGTT